jgi:hypothetical protein
LPLLALQEDAIHMTRIIKSNDLEGCIMHLWEIEVFANVAMNEKLGFLFYAKMPY